MDQKWFEMKDLKKRKLNHSVWVPLRSIKSIKNTVRFGRQGFQEEFLGHGSIAVNINSKKKAFELDWNDIGIRTYHYGKVNEGLYQAVDVYKTEDFEGINLVLHQHYNSLEVDEWHLHQDLVTKLGLLREKDLWLCPEDGYLEVARLERDQDGAPTLIEIRNQYLKEYLRIRDCGLYITGYYSRDLVADKTDFLSWTDESVKEKGASDSWDWECRIIPIHEGGFPYGQKIFVTHVGRTDIDENEDIPNISEFPTDENTIGESYEKEAKGKKLYRVISELWKNEWIEPSQNSIESLNNQSEDIFFIIDEEGKKKSGSWLIDSGRWLWFEPSVANSLLSKRGSYLGWYTKETGSIACSPDWGVHFGINELGYVTVYAKDIGNLPTWQQQIWAGHNIPPEGGISKELHASQVLSEPATTLAPESFLKRVVLEINEVSNNCFGVDLFRIHDATIEIHTRIHRFRAIDHNGLLSLAKDITRVIIDDLDTKTIQQIATPPKGTNWGSIKSLENLLALKIKKETARVIVGPLVGIYELRHGDAHLPTSKLQDSLKLLEIQNDQPYIIQGHQLLYSIVDHLYAVKSIIQNWNG